MVHCGSTKLDTNIYTMSSQYQMSPIVSKFVPLKIQDNMAHIGVILEDVLYRMPRMRDKRVALLCFVVRVETQYWEKTGVKILRGSHQR